MNLRLLASMAAAAVLATAACGGHGIAPPPTGPNAGFSGPSQFEWGQSQLQNATLIGPANAGVMHVNVMVRQQNLRGLVEYAQEAANPSSPLYRHFLTPQEIGDRFGATRTDYQNAANYFMQQGLAVSGWPQRMILAVGGPQQSMERAFGTRFGLYEKNGKTFVAPMSTPRLSLAVPVTQVGNLVQTKSRRTMLIHVPPRAGANQANGYSPQQVQATFDFSGAYKSGFNGAGITVGIIGTGPIDQNDIPTLQTFYNGVAAATVQQVSVTASDVASGLQKSGIPTAAPASPDPNGFPQPNPSTSPSAMFPYPGDFATPPPTSISECSDSLPACNPEDGEAQLDTQQVAILAPGSTVQFYLAYSPSDCAVYFANTCPTAPPSPGPLRTPMPPPPNVGQPAIGLALADAEIQEAIAKNQADVISISYGGGETQQGGVDTANGTGFMPAEFAALAAEGVAVFVSSGDTGVAGCLDPSGLSYLAQACVEYPAADPNVTAVGGVTVAINEFGQLTAPMTAWGTTTSLGNGGSGGGTSAVFTAPSWQASIGATRREVPDVAMLADPNTGVTMIGNASCCPALGVHGGGTFSIGGTSVAAPQMAAMWALVLQACQAQTACATAGGAAPWRLGNAAPYLYAILSGKAGVPGNSGFTPQLPYNKVFYDIVYGTNGMVNPTRGAPIQGPVAGPGYDQVTGVGVPFAGHLIDAVVPGENVP